MALDDILQIDLKGELYGEKVVNSFYYKVTLEDDPSVQAAQTFLPLFLDDVLRNDLLAIQSEDFKYTCATAKRIFPDEGPMSVTFITDVGLVTGDALPPSSVFKFQIYSTTLTKRGRGRRFISGVPESSQDRGNVIGAARANVLTFAGTLNKDIEDATPDNTAEPVIWSPTYETDSPVVYARPRMQIYSLKSRQTRPC